MNCFLLAGLSGDIPKPLSSQNAKNMYIGLGSTNGDVAEIL